MRQMYGSKQLWTTKAKELWFCSHKIYLYFFSCKKRRTFDQVMNLSWVHFQVHTFTDYPQWGPQPHIWIGNYPNLPFTYYTNYDCHARIEFFNQHIYIFFSRVFRRLFMNIIVPSQEDGFLTWCKWWWELNHILLWFSSQRQMMMGAKPYSYIIFFTN